MEQKLSDFLKELSILTNKYGIEITNDHTSVLLCQKDSDCFYEHTDMLFDEKEKKYTVTIDDVPYVMGKDTI